MKLALSPLNRFVIAAVLATVGASAMAEGPTAVPATPATVSAGQSGHAMMDHHDPVKMQAWMAKRQADMKAQLRITASQEAAWTRYIAAMQPPARMMGERPTAEQRAEFDKLTTPERIDKMRVLRTQRMADMNAAMDQRGEATKVFYAALSAEQQKVFDAGHEKMGHSRGHGHSERMDPKG